MPPPKYLSAVEKTTIALASSDGRPITVWELRPSAAKHLSEWAQHFRSHYCLDEEIDQLRTGTGLTRSDFLRQIILPDSSTAPGPSIRAGDFAELLISDLIEFLHGYWVPRGKYGEKATRNESVKGVDILGFRFVSEVAESPGDTLIAFEAKAQLSGGTYAGRLQYAIDDSSQDYIRRSMSLHATKRRLLRAGNEDGASKIARFQNIADAPYVYLSGAAAVLSDDAYDEALISTSTTAAQHNNSANLQLVVVRGSDLMTLVHALYDCACNEA